MPSVRTSIWIVAVTSVALIAAACGSDGENPADGSGSGVATETSATEAPGHAMAEMGAPFDAAFIDSMIEHHRGAISMAEQALVEAEHPELRAMAEQIIEDQETEIAQMESWREEWYPEVAPTGGMDMPMGDMELSTDESIPFDQRFIDAMIAHHQGAVDMAEEALAQAEHEQLRSTARTIIDSQTAEIGQMEEWEEEWFAS